VAFVDELENLERAFPPRPIEPAGAFAEWGGTYVDAEAFRKGVRGKRWPELEVSFLEHHDADDLEYKRNKAAIDITNRGVEKCKGMR
jgi:hypothetical protein